MKVFSENEVEAVAGELLAGEVVAMPTETVFGLAVSADSEDGIRKLASLKERGVESGKVFTLVPESVQAISKYALIGAKAEELIRQYVPGALTLVLPKNPEYRNEYFDNFDEIGVRIPDFALFREVLPLSGALLLTSANFRGEETLGSAKEVAEKLPVDGVVWGEAGGEMASTVVRVAGERVEVLRRGGIRFE